MDACAGRTARQGGSEFRKSRTGDVQGVAGKMVWLGVGNVARGSFCEAGNVEATKKGIQMISESLEYFGSGERI